MKYLGCVVLVALVCSVAAPAGAQPPLSYALEISNQGATTPLSTTPIPAASFTCNQTAPASTVTANPNKVLFTDPDNVGKVCLFTDQSPTGPLLSLPFGTGTYTATIAIVNSAGTGPKSLASPTFTQPGSVGNAPTGLRVYR